MGLPMAKRLVEAGRVLLAMDLSPAAMASAKAVGATEASSLEEIGAACEVTITILPNIEAVQSVILGRAGGDCLLRGLNPGALVIDMSSSAPLGTQELGAVLAQSGIGLVDAPVSGG